MNFKEFSTWLLTGAVAALVAVLCYFGDRSLGELVLIRSEMTTLNGKMIQVVNNQGWQQTEVLDLKDRVKILEGKIR